MMTQRFALKRASKKDGARLRKGNDAAEVLEPRAREAAHLLKLLSSEQRLTILCRLSGGEMSVGELGQHVELSQSALSQHLAKLRAERIVTTRRDAQTIYYHLADANAEKLVAFLCQLYGGKG
ncbi:MAG: ArsR/SmtB family transcription factor [Amphiplicatus sp.]